MTDPAQAKVKTGEKKDEHDHIAPEMDEFVTGQHRMDIRGYSKRLDSVAYLFRQLVFDQTIKQASG